MLRKIPEYLYIVFTNLFLVVKGLGSLSRYLEMNVVERLPKASVSSFRDTKHSGIVEFSFTKGHV